MPDGNQNLAAWRAVKSNRRALLPKIFRSTVTRQKALDPEVEADAPQKFV